MTRNGCRNSEGHVNTTRIPLIKIPPAAGAQMQIDVERDNAALFKEQLDQYKEHTLILRHDGNVKRSDKRNSHKEPLYI